MILNGDCSMFLMIGALKDHLAGRIVIKALSEGLRGGELVVDAR
jgi:hypothetical protein